MASPADIAGLVNRWRADSIAQDNGTAVSAWPSLVGGATLTQGISANRPTYVSSSIGVKPAVRFTGSNSTTLTATVTQLPQPFTVSTVLQWASVAALAEVLSAGPTEMVITPGQWDGYSGVDLAGGAPATGTNYIFTYVANGTSSAVYINGTAVATGNSGTGALTSTIWVGSNGTARFASMDLAEVNVYSHALAASELATLDTYYYQNYGISSPDATTTPTPGPVAGPPPTPIPATRWVFAMGDWHGLPTRQLVSATSRSCKLRLTGTSEASFTIDGTSPDATAVQELVADLWVVRNGFTLHRGRVGNATDTLDGTKHTIAVSTGDYRALLARRQLLDADTLTYTSTDAAAIGWSLISTTQARTGGSVNITNGSTAVGSTRTITYPAGQRIGQAIEQLSLMDAGWNWDIVPTTGQIGQVYTTWRSRGISHGRVLDYPGRIASLTRTVDPGTYANAIRETGNTGVAAVSVAASDIATRVEGRWEDQLGDTSLLDAASVTSRANYDLANRGTITPSYTVKLYPGAWGGPLDIWLGDVVELRVVSGRLNVDTFVRVWEIDIALDDADNETVTLTVSGLDPFKRARSRQVEFRLQNLERR